MEAGTKREWRNDIGRWLAAAIVAGGIAYLGAYLSLRLSGSIRGHVAQGFVELEFHDSGMIQLFPETVRTKVLLCFCPLMWVENPFLRIYVSIPTGG